MKKIILILLILSAGMAVKAQLPTYTGYTNINSGYQWLRGLFAALGAPAGGNAAFQTGQAQRAGALYYDSTGTDSGFYYYSGTQWRKIGEGGIDSTLASQGLLMSGDTVVLGSPIGGQAAFSNERVINTNRLIMHWTNGIAAEQGGAYWQFTRRPYSPYQFISQDTVPGDDQNASYARPLSGIYARRVVYFPAGTYKTIESYGHYFGQTYSFQDSMVAKTQGGDYQEAVIAELRIKPRTTGTPPVFRTGHGTNGNLRLQEGVPALLANFYMDSDGSNRLKLNGTGIAFTPYLVHANNANDTINNFVYIAPGNLQSGKVLKSYLFAPAVSTTTTDSSFGWYDTARVRRSFHAGKYVFGAGAQKATNDGITLYGNLTMSDSLIVGTQTQVSDTTGYDIVLRRRTDGSYVRIRADQLTLGGSTPGIDDVLAVGQALTTARTINTNGGALQLFEGATQYGRFTLGDGYLYSLNGSNANGFIHNTNASGGLAQIESVYSGGTKNARVKVASDAVSGKIVLDADSIIANPISQISTDTTNYKPVVIGPGNHLAKSYWYGTGSGGVPALTQYRLAVGDASNLLSSGAAITGDRVLVSDANGVPTHSTASPAMTGTVATGTGVTVTTFPAVLDADFTLTNTTSVQSAFPTSMDVWTLAANTTYEFEVMLDVTCGTTSSAMGFGFALGTATVASISMQMQGFNAAVDAVQTAQGFMWHNSITPIAPITAAVNAGKHIYAKGIMRTGTGGTITPQVQFSADPTGTILMKANSWIKFTPYGADTFTKTGITN